MFYYNIVVSFGNYLNFQKLSNGTLWGIMIIILK